MSIRFAAAATLLLVLMSSGARAFDDIQEPEGGNRVITIIKPVNSGSLFPFSNPGIVTLGTLSIQGRVDFAISAFTTNGNPTPPGVTPGSGGALTFLWNWGDGTPNGTGALPNHTYVVAGVYKVTVTTTEAGNPTPTVNTLTVTITDGVKSSKLQTNELFAGSSGDSLTLKGVVRIPTHLALQGQLALIQIGGGGTLGNGSLTPGLSGGNTDGIILPFVMDAKGNATLSTNLNYIFDTTALTVTTSVSNCTAKLRLNYRTRNTGVDFVDTPFTVTVMKASFNKALSAEIPSPAVTKVNPNRDNVRFTVKVTFPTFPILPTTNLVPPTNTAQVGMVFQSGINQLYTATPTRGKTR